MSIYLIRRSKLSIQLFVKTKTISYKELVGSGKKQLNFSEVNLEEATKYAAEDADVGLDTRGEAKAFDNAGNAKVLDTEDVDGNVFINGGGPALG